MTIYTDVFSGKSITSPIAYQSVNLQVLTNVQLIWPNQDINTINKANISGTNLRVGNITELNSTTLVNNSVIYLPDVTREAKGATFTMVDRTVSGSVIKIYSYDGSLLTTLESYKKFSGINYYTFYLVDNSIQTGWHQISTPDNPNTSSSSIPFVEINNTTDNYKVVLVLKGGSAPSPTPGIVQVQADVILLTNIGSKAYPGYIKLPTPTQELAGYSFLLINELGKDYRLWIKEYNGSDRFMDVNINNTHYNYRLTFLGLNYGWRIEPILPEQFINHLMGFNKLEFSSLNQTLYLCWANSMLYGIFVYAAKNLEITDNSGSIDNCTIRLPEVFNVDPLGINFNLKINNADLTKKYNICDSSNNLVTTISGIQKPYINIYLKDNSGTKTGSDMWGVTYLDTEASEVLMNAYASVDFRNIGSNPGTIRMFWSNQKQSGTGYLMKVASLIEFIDASPWTQVSIYLPDVSNIPVGTSFYMNFFKAYAGNRKVPCYVYDFANNLLFTFDKNYSTYVRLFVKSNSGTGSAIWGVCGVKLDDGL